MSKPNQTAIKSKSAIEWFIKVIHLHSKQVLSLNMKPEHTLNFNVIISTEHLNECLLQPLYDEHYFVFFYRSLVL